MTDGTVLISTHELPLAGALRKGFAETGYATDLVTADERISEDAEAVLLVLTGGLEEWNAGLVRQARETLHIPVFGISDTEEPLPPRVPGFDKVFSQSSPVEDIVVLGRRAIERRASSAELSKSPCQR